MNLYFLELRARIIKSILSITGIFAILFWFRERLYEFIALPIINSLPAGSNLVATNITATFMAPTKLSFIAAIYLSVPLISYQIWRFVAPGLYKTERRAVLPHALLSMGLFALGNIFAFYTICPLALSFFAACAPKNVLILADINLYLDFVLTIMFTTGLAFQVPLITKLLIKTGIFSKETLRRQRPYIIVLAFILGMLLTPPDVISQILLALPMWGLFELGLWLS
jgi:sec-independent protein translocase protein TatC